MLRAIASTAASYAVEGVIPASAIASASRAEQLEHIARKRADTLLKTAKEQAQDITRHAMAQGYAHGYADAMAAFIPQAMDLLSQERALVDAAVARLRILVQETFGQVGMEAALIAHCCAMSAEAPTERALLRLPRGRDDLLAALTELPSMRCVELRLDDVVHPLLELGKLVFEFDPERELLKEAEPLLRNRALKESLARTADAYVEHVCKAALEGERRSRFKSIGEYR
ncbi:MAG TPA: hypothetical protein VIM98_20290 [Dyella sp.]|uniref:hypothetical protein n=1 Tax=Dyella sp. TaxID=1869338 RepID=UPI002F93E751